MPLRRYKRRNLASQKFGKWTVLSPAALNDGTVGWLCRCSCGNTGVVVTNGLLSGHSKSCGCLVAEKARMRRKHGASNKGGAYAIWNNMKYRCRNKNIVDYKNYGGRGISVCPRWEKSFANFIADMGPRPKGTSLDRINNDGNYEPGNCRWASPLEQINNRRSTRHILYRGETRPLAMWAKHFGIDYTTVYNRVRLGWSLEKIFGNGPE